MILFAKRPGFFIIKPKIDPVQFSSQESFPPRDTTKFESQLLAQHTADSIKTELKEIAKTGNGKPPYEIKYDYNTKKNCLVITYANIKKLFICSCIVEDDLVPDDVKEWVKHNQGHFYMNEGNVIDMAKPSELQAQSSKQTTSMAALISTPATNGLELNLKKDVERFKSIDEINTFIKTSFSAIETAVSNPQARVKIIDHLLKINIDIEQDRLVHIVADILGLLNDAAPNKAANEMAKRSIRLMGDGLRGIDFENSLENCLQGQGILNPEQIRNFYFSFLIQQKAEFLLKDKFITIEKQVSDLQKRLEFINEILKIGISTPVLEAIDTIRKVNERSNVAGDETAMKSVIFFTAGMHGLDPLKSLKDIFEQISLSRAQIHGIFFNFLTTQKELLTAAMVLEPKHVLDLAPINKPLILSRPSYRSSLSPIVEDLVEDKPKKALANNKN